jgi:hypothetical protein
MFYLCSGIKPNRRGALSELGHLVNEIRTVNNLMNAAGESPIILRGPFAVPLLRSGLGGQHLGCMGARHGRLRPGLRRQIMRRIIIVSGFVFSFASSAQAQVSVDVAKITCDQYVNSKIAAPRLVAAWVSGYYNAKRDNHIIDLQNFEANLRKLKNFCYQEKNYNIPLMQAVEQVLGAGR